MSINSITDRYALEMAIKLSDINSMMKIYIRQQNWDKAFALASENKGLFSSEIFLPYAQYLVENDKYFEAQSAYASAGKPEESMKMLESLVYGAVNERRFSDGSYYYFLLSEEYKNTIKNPRRSKEIDIE